MKKILGIIVILITCVSCTQNFRYDDIFIIKSISKAERYSRYEYVYEINHYDDSDWYAVCWDDERKSVVEIPYDTTRFGTNGSYAVVDCTTENLRKAYRYYYNRARDGYNRYNYSQACEVHVGDVVKVVYGRKVPKGTIGRVFWQGSVYNKFSYTEERRVGIDVTGTKLFLPELYTLPVDWEGRMVSGKKRKEWIRNHALADLHRRETALMPLKIAFKQYKKAGERNG